ncbi:T9SS type A sorting domain-containing protein [Sporocytophaga myxococcoides]|uniref:T9SS type A sorting domain-containing protein n=1 Tax=Sporocytophaga myxococcoides TaxID=153721 RepID=UPI00040D28B6|nr:T9SS type A sorting domain-containing protein [Sporocytophaga myxococcoides]
MNKILPSILIFFIICSFSVNAQMCPPKAGSTEYIPEGNFESTTTVANDFTQCTSGCNPLGGDQYVIGTNPKDHNSGYFANMQDHTPGAGSKMLIFDFNDASTGSVVFKKSITVTAGKTYFFSAWFANVGVNNYVACPTCPGGQYIRNSPTLKFTIDGKDAGVVKTDSLSNNWTQFFSEYTALTTKTIEITIINTRGGNQSNDLALDDISFTDGCDKITNLSSLGQSSALPDTIYNCNVAFPYSLNPGLPASYGYAWKKVSATTLSTSTTYSEPPTPADGTWLYLCYEYIPGCPRKDSVIFKNTPIKMELGSDKVMCAPVNFTITSGISTPPAVMEWYKDGVLLPTETGSNYIATDIGTYKAIATRLNCGTATDQLKISSPVSSFSGTGSYCDVNDKATFTTTASKAKWYTVPTGGIALNPSNTDNTINLTYTATNRTTPGCPSGLYVEDVSSYPGAAMPTAPCATTNANDGFVEVEINQQIELTSFDFYQNTGWGDPATFTFDIYPNDPTKGPYNGFGNQGGPGAGALFPTKSIGPLSASTNTVRTMPVGVTLTPGKYWFKLASTGGALGLFNCSPTRPANSSEWGTPITDNTGNNVMNLISAITGGSPGTTNGSFGSSGPLFNMKFQVGSNNACSRLFICASKACAAPVDFLSFDVKKVSNGNILLWKTTSETNSSHFVLERSIDGINFESVGRVKAAGNSGSVLSYSYLDSRVFSSYETVYYRIQEVDLDGSFTYSKLKSLSDKSSGFASVFPIPVKRGQILTLEYFSEENSDLNIALYNNMGSFILNKEFKVEKGYNTIEISTSDLMSGFYLLKSDSFTDKIFVE